MKFIKKSKNIIIGIIVLIIVVAAVLGIKWLFFGNSNSAIYGNRLEGRDKVKITEDRKNSVKEALTTGKGSVSVRIQGRIININIVVDGDLSLEEAKAMGQTAVDKFSEEEKNYYDIQVFVQNKDNPQFPIIGYKHHANGAIVWTKDRTES